MFHALTKGPPVYSLCKVIRDLGGEVKHAESLIVGIVRFVMYQQYLVKVE